jgi:hypothetical protein
MVPVVSSLVRGTIKERSDDSRTTCITAIGP